MKVYAIIPAGGSGKRISKPIPKQFFKINGKELIAYTLEVFQNCSLINDIIIAAQPEYFELINDIKERYKIDKLDKIVEGGKERQNSVFNALVSIDAAEADLVAVHDAARPLLPKHVLENSINSAVENGNSVAAIRAKDTLANYDNNRIKYIDRSNIYYIQTPQVFKADILKRALHEAAEKKIYGTDESMLVDMIGEKINIVEGSELNFKITTESDLELFHQMVVKER